MMQILSYIAFKEGNVSPKIIRGSQHSNNKRDKGIGKCEESKVRLQGGPENTLPS
jgi:hypothetical protein